MITILRYLQWTLFTKCTIPRLAQGKCSIAGAHPTAAAAAAAVAKSLQCPALCDPIDGSPPGCPWDPPGKNTGVGCHFLLQCMKAKSESEVTQSGVHFIAILAELGRSRPGPVISPKSACASNVDNPNSSPS